MKKLACFLLLAALATAPTFAQQPEKPKSNAPHPQLLTVFSLDFPGGTPEQLVSAIQRAMGHPLNVIVPVEYANWKLPPLKMNNVDVAQLFHALEVAGQTRTVIATGNGSYQRQDSNYGFRTIEGNPSDDTVWFFSVNGAAATPKIARFYFLAPYLDGGLTIDDITTAIQTAWKMRGDESTPALSFHKETKLLIAVGDYGQLDVIESALKALDSVKRPAPEPKTKP